MAKQKTKIKRYVVTVTQTQLEALERLMEEDMQENVSQYFGMMIAEVTRNREGTKAKRSVGRPKNETDTDSTTYYPCPYDKNAPPYTMDELIGYHAMRKEKVPEGLKPLTKEELKKWDM